MVFLLLAYGIIRPHNLEAYFYKYEQVFQSAADAYMREGAYKGEKRWLSVMPESEGGQYLSFHMGDDYEADFYKPRIVYVNSDDVQHVGECSFDGQLIQKIQYQWYICQEARF
ncbi:MAG: hypothetical protein ACRBEE_13055 [Arenicella sp.]